MARVIQPSREAMQKAWTLGRKMALSDRAVRPILTDAPTFKKYEDFRTAHRGLLESSEAFGPWEEHLNSLAEREARRMGLKVDISSASLDMFIAKVVVPMKHALWLGWEGARGLDRLFAQVRLRMSEEASAAESGVQVFRATQLSDRVQKPEVKEDGDAFFLSVTGNGGEVRDKDKPAVLAASKLVNVAKPGADADGSGKDGGKAAIAKVAAADELSLGTDDLGEIDLAAITVGVKPKPAESPVIADDDVPDPYEQ